VRQGPLLIIDDDIDASRFLEPEMCSRNSSTEDVSGKQGKGVTAFQSCVYSAAELIPAGYVTTYKLLAAHVGCKSPRAVGQALKRNPFAPRVPCHRVISTDLTLGGFRGARSGPDLALKKRMLMEEGVAFKGDKLSDPSRVYRYGAS
jgi:methylated-DNA-[protein]-cysteine S-methyltransferase